MVSTSLGILVLYWEPQNSRNNSMGQCQLLLENNEKNDLKNLWAVGITTPLLKLLLTKVVIKVNIKGYRFMQL
jgi:hypothetical protein